MNELMYNEVLKNLILYNPIQNKIRIGRNGDGGYVIVDNYNYDCFISAGLLEEITFELDFVKKYPNLLNVVFDGSIEKPINLPSNIEFVKKFIGINDNYTFTNLKKYVTEYNNVFIKLDIEGEEWEWIKSFEDFFPKVKQIVFEAHGIFFGDVPDFFKFYFSNSLKIEWPNNILDSLKILNKTHYLVHVHQNSISPFIKFNENFYPTVFDLTFIRKDSEIEGLNKNKLPIKNIDFPTGSPYMSNDFIERDMNFYPFKF